MGLWTLLRLCPMMASWCLQWLLFVLQNAANRVARVGILEEEAAEAADVAEAKFRTPKRDGAITRPFNPGSSMQAEAPEFG